MKRQTLALLAAVVAGVIAFLALEHHYESGAVTIDVSDGQGDGPDQDTAE